MRLLKIVLVVFLFGILVTPTYAFTIYTPLGIRIIASDATVAQYNAHWATWDKDPDVILFPKRPGIFPYYKQYKGGPKWVNIDWSVIDDWFTLLRGKYQSYPNPRALTIQIKPLNYNCVDESGFPYSYEYFQSGYGCIDGQLWNANLINIHLGDDSGLEWWGKMNRPFCATALDWEMRNYFLYWKGDGCWWDEFNPACDSHYRDAHEMCE
jgi:hypothetical protein